MAISEMTSRALSSFRLLLMHSCTSCFQSWVQRVLWIQGLESLLCGTLAHLPHALHRPARLPEWYRDLNHLGQWDSGNWLGQDTCLEVTEARSHPQPCQEHRGTAITIVPGHCALKGRALKAPWDWAHTGASLFGFSKGLFICLFQIFLVVTVIWSGLIWLIKLVCLWQGRRKEKLNSNFLPWLKDRLYRN